MNSFREIIDAFGIAQLAKVLGIQRNHVRTMKARDVIPPQYWRKILDAWPAAFPKIKFEMLDDLYSSKNKEAAE